MISKASAGWVVMVNASSLGIFVPLRVLLTGRSGLVQVSRRLVEERP